MILLAKSVEHLAKLGANIEITGEQKYLPNNIENIVKIVVSKGNTIRISAKGLLPATLENFVKIGGNNITIII